MYGVRLVNAQDYLSEARERLDPHDPRQAEALERIEMAMRRIHAAHDQWKEMIRSIERDDAA
jgi:hypothetical protein